MFWTVLGEVLTPGLGAALSPMMIVAALLFASAEGGTSKSVMFALGDFVAMAILGVGGLLLSRGAQVGAESGPSTVVTVLRLALGVLFLFLAWSQFSKRPQKGEEPELPTWMTKLDSMSAGRALLMGLAFGVANVKNLPLTISVATSVAQVGASPTVSVIGMLIFAALGSLGVAAPALIVKLKPEDSQRLLSQGRTFLVHNNAIIMAMLYLILGMSAISKSLGPLFG